MIDAISRDISGIQLGGEEEEEGEGQEEEGRGKRGRGKREKEDRMNYNMQW